MATGIELLLSTIICATCNLTINPGPVNNVVLSDYEPSGVIKMQYMDKIRKDLNGRVLRVTSLEDFPLSYTTTENGTRRGRGVAFEVFDFMAQKFNFTYEVIMPEKNILGSGSDMDGSLLQILANGSVDMAVAFIPIFSEIRNYILYSTSLDEGDWMMVMIRPTESASGSGLLAPFDRDVWLLILVSLLAVGPIIYLLIIVRHRLTRNNDQKSYPLPHCVWFVYGGLMKQGSTLSPTADSTRILFATWWIFITILTSFYTANLTAFLTLSKFTLPINNVPDILKKQQPLVTHRGNAVEYAIRNTDESLSMLNVLVTKRLVEFTQLQNDTEILINLVEKRNYVFVRDRPAVQHLIYNDYIYRKTISASNEKIHCPFATASNPFLRRKRAFAYQKNTTLDVLFDPQLLNLVESGIIKYKLLQNLPRAEICPQNLGSTERQLRNGDLMTTYYVTITGFCTASVVFFSEMFFKYLNHRTFYRNRRSPNTVARNVKNITNETLKTIANTGVTGYSPPPPYAAIYNRSQTKKDNQVRKMINGRNYIVVKEFDGKSRLIPIRTPSAALFQYTYTN